MNILKYLIAETINDDNGEDKIEFSQTREINHEGIADSVFQAFATLSSPNSEVGSREKPTGILANSDIVLNESIFTQGGLMAHLDTVH